MDRVPKVGDVIYIDSSLYIDDFPPRDVHGGKVRVTSVEKSNDRYWIAIEGFPGTTYSWDNLSDMQESLKSKFGDTLASRQ